jgi:transmembrane sensor
MVQVLGTEFELERVRQRTRVVVLRGRVAVTWPGGRSELAAGEAGWFPRDDDEDIPQLGAARPSRIKPAIRRSPLMAADDEPAATLRQAAPARDKRAETRRPKAQHGARPAETEAQATTWREPAEQGDFDRAYEMLRHAPQPSPDDVEELLLAADTARLSGHPSAALPFLKQVIEGHSQDSRAPLAAFTLGGLLMQQLGQPREAEAAYARARALSLNSSLAEDALARQVEAAHRAGDASRARALAEEYLARYPSGRRVHAVQRFGGMSR